MHGITRCPNCRKAFRVSHNQLVGAHGKVKCGACKHVFSATDHWLVAEYDKNDQQLSKLDFELSQPSNNTHNIWLASIILVGVIGLFLQFAWEYPGRIIARVAYADKIYTHINSITNRQKSLIDLRDLSLSHFAGRLYENGRQMRIDGVVKSQSPTAQNKPNLRMDFTLNDGKTVSKFIKATDIQWSKSIVPAHGQIQFEIGLEMQQPQVIDYKVSICCQPKN